MNKKSIPAQKNWILIPVYNRLEVTRSCLNNLRKLGIFSNFTVCVIDDGCTDGTAEMLANEYPEAQILRGDGNLYWGGGIALGMAEARSRGAEVIVWLNDDCLPDPGSIETTISRVRETHGICGGVCRDPENPDIVTYSGSRAGDPNPVDPPPGTFQSIDGMNGNLVAVHAAAVRKIGVLDSRRFPHYGGDAAYCITARRADIPVEIAGSARAINPRGSPFASFGRTKPASAIFREPFRIASCLYWPTHFHILRLAYGWQAYVRWPAYLARLLRLWSNARRIELTQRCRQ